jgi:hypothetical protein
LICTSYKRNHGVRALARRVVGVLPQERNQGTRAETVN